MKRLSMLLGVSCLTFGCASAQVGGGHEADLRGHVLVAGPSVKAVVVGPAEFHAYSGFAGGAIYMVPAVAGTDHDCGSTSAGVTTLEPDRVRALRVEAGHVACLATMRTGSFELLWHGHHERAEPGTVVAVGSGR